MSFQARNLRVQLPCGSATVVDCGTASVAAPWGPCVYASVPITDRCEYGSVAAPWGPCVYASVPITDLCVGSEPIDLRVTVRPEELGILKERLQAQLSEIENAEKAVRESGYEPEQPAE